jgi:hypothetical protein
MPFDRRNYLTTPIALGKNFQEGYDTRKIRMAGETAATGNYRQAASEVMPYDPGAAANYLKLGDYEDDRAYGRDVSGALAARDYGRAAGIAAERGRPDDALKFTDKQTAYDTEQQKRDVISAYGTVMRVGQVPEQYRQSTYDAAVAFASNAMKKAGYPPAIFSQFAGEYTPEKASEFANLLAEGGRGYGLDLRPKPEKRESLIVPDGSIVRYDDGTTFENPRDFAPQRGGGGERGAEPRPTRLQPEAKDSIEKARTATANASSLAGEATRWLQLNSQRGTGGYGEKTRFLNSPLWDDPARQEMRAITARVTPLMRAPGSGTMSDKDIEMFQRGTLSIENLYPVNQTIAKAMIAAGDNAQGYIEFLEQYAMDNEGSTLGASRLWNDYLNANRIFTEKGELNPNRRSWRDWVSSGGFASAAKSAAGSAAAPAQGRDLSDDALLDLYAPR